jgi:hypothetical protein
MRDSPSAINRSQRFTYRTAERPRPKTAIRTRTPGQPRARVSRVSRPDSQVRSNRDSAVRLKWRSPAQDGLQSEGVRSCGDIRESRGSHILGNSHRVRRIAHDRKMRKISDNGNRAASSVLRVIYLRTCDSARAENHLMISFRKDVFS